MRETTPGPKRRRITFWRASAALLLLVLLCSTLLVAFRPTGKNASFEAYVCYPIPESVRHIRCQDDGPLGLLLEPVVYMRFSARADEMKQIIETRHGKIVESKDEGLFASRTGPSWWYAQPLNDGSQLYRLRGNQKGMTGKRGIEWLRVDATGTNAFYLLWGI